MSKKAVHTTGLPTPINNWARSRSRLITSFSPYEMGTTLARKATTDASITNSSNLAMLTVGVARSHSVDGVPLVRDLVSGPDHARAVD
jgi:hypothetical protein